MTGQPFATKPFLYLFVFITGMAVIAIELTASRILAPYFGSSIFVWGNIIGVTLAALALSYRWGGRLADQHPHANVLYMIILAGGVLTSVIPLVVNAVVGLVLATMQGFQLTLIFGSFLSLLVLFAAPLILLGISSPFAIRLLAKDVASTGNVAGTVYAFSTAGSILGSFLTTFATIPLLGSRETIFLFSFTILCVSAVGLARRWPLALAMPLIPVVLWVLLSGKAVRPTQGLVFETESPYQFIQVVREDDGALTIRANDGRGVQSIYNESRAFTDKYFDYFAVLPYLLETPTPRILNVGTAGGTIARIFLDEVQKDTQLEVDGVEIDPVMTQLAKKYFALDELPLDIVHEDGRSFLRQNEKTYDIIIVDAYSQQIYIPFHLATQEFFSLIKARLAPGGIMSINVNAVRSDSKLLTSILETLRSVFAYVESAPTPGTYNYFITASESPIDYVAFRRHPSSSYITDLAWQLKERTQSVESSGALVLTDNRAPVELLTDAMFFTLVRESRADELL